MKRCPACDRTFDDTLTFCLIDGSILDAPFEPRASSDTVLPGSQPTLAPAPPTQRLMVGRPGILSEGPEHEQATVVRGGSVGGIEASAPVLRPLRLAVGCVLAMFIGAVSAAVYASVNLWWGLGLLFSDLF